MAFLLKGLIKRIEDTRDEANPAGDRLLGAPASAASGDPVLIDDEFLTDSQDAALGSALGRDITFIRGPPGTGKTETIGAIGEQLYLRNRSVLLVSHTNAAVDQALLKIAGALDGRFAHGALLRLGIPNKPELAEREDLLLDGAVRERQRELRMRQDELEGEKLELQRLIAEADRQLEVVRWAAEADSELADQRARLAALRRAETEVDAGEQQAIALAGDDEAQRRETLGKARRVDEANRDALAIEQRRVELEARAATLRDTIKHRKQSVGEAEKDHRTAEAIFPLKARERALPRLAEHRAALEATAARQSGAQTDLNELVDDLAGGG